MVKKSLEIKGSSNNFCTGSDVQEKLLTQLFLWVKQDLSCSAGYNDNFGARRETLHVAISSTWKIVRQNMKQKVS